MVEATEHCLVPKIAPKGRVNVIAFSGDLGHTGEVEGLLRSFRHVIDKIPDALLIIAGSASQRGRCDDLQAYANELDLVENVKFLGQLTRDKLPAFYASATVLALPREKGKFSDAGLPTKLAKYMLSGAAVLTTAVGDIPLYIKDGWNGYLVPPGCDKAFAEKILYILSHQEEAVLVGQRGRVKALEQFECVSACRPIINLYENATN